MYSQKFKAKGYTDEDFNGKPVVDITINTVLSIDEIEVILDSLRKPFHDMSEGLSFKIEIQDIDV